MNYNKRFFTQRLNILVSNHLLDCLMGNEEMKEKGKRNENGNDEEYKWQNLKLWRK